MVTYGKKGNSSRDNDRDGGDVEDSSRGRDRGARGGDPVRGSRPPGRPPGRPPRTGRGIDELRDARQSLPSPSRIDRYLPSEDREDLNSRRYGPDDFYVYSPEDFRVEIKNEADHDTRIAGIRFHPQMANEIHMLIARGNFPIDDAHAFLRLAAFELMIKLYQLERKGGVPNYVARLKIINHLALQSKQNREFEGTLQVLRNEVRALTEQGRAGAAAMLVHDVLREAKQITERTWRGHYLKEIEREHGQLIKEQSRKVKVRRRE